MEMISLKNVSKVYELGGHKIHALDEVDLSIKKGEFISILGPSGSGKSTMLNMIGLLDNPTKGKVKLENVDSPFLVEEKSRLNIDGERIESDQRHVKEFLTNYLGI